MNALRKILNNLQKYATTVKNNVNAVTPLLPENRSLKETDLDIETPQSEIGVNPATPQTIDTNECLKEFDDILEEINKDVTKGASLDDIDDVLKDMAREDPKDFMFEVPKFDLAEISAAFENLKDDDVDITNSLISLDDNIISFSDIYSANSNDFIEQNDAISISSEYSSPAGSIKNFSTKNTRNVEQNIDINSMNTEETKESIKHSESMECETLDIDNKYISAKKDQGIEKQANFHVATGDEIDKTNEPTDKTNECIQTNLVDSCKKVNGITIKNVIFMDDSDDGYQSSDFEFITEEEAKMDGLILNFKKKTHKRKSAKVNRVKTIEVAEDQFTTSKKSLRRKKIKRKTRNIDEDPDWAPQSDTDSISDDEFVESDEEQRIGRSNTRSKSNNTPAKSPGRTNTVTFSLRQIRIPPKRYINLQINSDHLLSRNITEYNINVIKNNKERDCLVRNNFQGFSNECGNELATMKMECNDENNLFKTETDDLELAQVDYPYAEKVPDSVVLKTNGMQDGTELNNRNTLKTPEKDNVDPGPCHSQRPDENITPGSSFIQESYPDSNNMVIKTNGMQDGPELNNIATLRSPGKDMVDPGTCHSQRPEGNITPGTSRENVPDPNNLNPSPSRMEEVPNLVNFGVGPSCKRKRSHVDEIKKWRMYQMRTRLNRPQFVVDFSYRDNHRIYQDNDLHQLFDPNRAPLLTTRSIRLLENKSTVCKNSMLVEYQGVGFDVPLRRDSGSEDDEVKREANECAQKILEMYPGQNTRRPRRRRF